MDEVLKNIKTRRSIRRYRPEIPSREEIETIIDAGLNAASGMNNQSSVIIAVTDRELRGRLSRMNSEIGGWKPDFDPFYGAPLVLIVLDKADWRNRVYDGSLVIGNMMLEAHALGLGSCWIHRAKQEFETVEGKEILKSLGIEGEYEGIGHLAAGYPDGPEPAAPARKDGRVFFAE